MRLHLSTTTGIFLVLLASIGCLVLVSASCATSSCTTTNSNSQQFLVSYARTDTGTNFSDLWAIQFQPGAPIQSCTVTTPYALYALKGKQSSLYLHNSGTNTIGVSPNTGSNAVLGSSSSSSNAQWNLENTSGGLTLRNMYETNKVADVQGSGGSGTNVIVFPKKAPGSDSNQKWLETSRGSGYYSYHPMHDTTLALEVYLQQITSGSQIDAYTYNGGDNQLWSKVALNAGYCPAPPVVTCSFSNYPVLGTRTFLKVENNIATVSTDNASYPPGTCTMP